MKNKPRIIREPCVDYNGKFYYLWKCCDEYSCWCGFGKSPSEAYENWKQYIICSSYKYKFLDHFKGLTR